MRKQTVYLLKRARTDSNGNPLPGTQPRVPWPGCTLWPRASEEKDGGEINIDGQNVRGRDDALGRTIKADDRLEIDGEVHMVDEPPARYRGKAILLKTKRVTT